MQNPAVAEELAQDVFLRVHRSREKWEPSAKFTTWLFRISTNVAYNHFRDEKYHNRNVSLDREIPNSRKREFPDGRKGVETALVEDVRVSQIVGDRRPAIQAAHCGFDAQIRGNGLRADLFSSGLHTFGGEALMFRAYEALRTELAHMA